MDTKRGKWQGLGGGGVMNWEIGIDMYTVMCIKWMNNKNLLYKKINKIQKNKRVYICITDSLCCTEETQHCKSTRLQ